MPETHRDVSPLHSQQLVSTADLCVPLSRSVVSGGTSTEVAPVGVGAAELAGVLAGGALVDVGATPGGLLVVEAVGAEAAEAPQGVVA